MAWSRCLARRVICFVLLVFLAQESVFGSAVTPPVSAAQTPQPLPSLQLTERLTNLDAALQLSEQTPQAETIAAARAAWLEIAPAADQVRSVMVSQAREFALRKLDGAYARQIEQIQQHDHALKDLAESARALIAVDQRDPIAIRGAAATLRAALARHMSASTAPDLKQLLAPARHAPELHNLGDLHLLGAAHALAIPTSTNPAGPPDIADITWSDDIPRHSDIAALANQLGHDPVKIFAYVRNTIAFEPYFGSRKGALLTLWEHSGNATDTASLLIALLRASGYPARYVYGSVEVPSTQLRNWVGGAPDLLTAAKILLLGNIPVDVSSNGNLIVDHVWVEMWSSRRYATFLPILQTSSAARAAALPSIEWASQASDHWIALDPSFKQFTFRQPADLSSLNGGSAAQWIDEVRAVTAVDDTSKTIFELPRIPVAGNASNPDADQDYVAGKVDAAAQAVRAYIQARPQLTNIDLLGGAQVITNTLTALPAALPLPLAAGTSLARFSILPDVLRSFVTIELYTPFGARSMSYRSALASLANQRVTVSYVAATPADQAVINSYGGSLLTTPPIVNLVPVLRLNGVALARGQPARMGTFLTRSMTLAEASGLGASYTPITLQNRTTVGEIYAVGLAYGRGSLAALQASRQRLRAALPHDAAGRPDGASPAMLDETAMGEMLNQLILAYFTQDSGINELLARNRQVRWFRSLGGGVAMQRLVFDYGLDGLPLQTRGGGLGLDIQANQLNAVSLRGQPNDERVFWQSSGRFSSALEHAIFEASGFGSLSTIRLLNVALERGVPVYRIDATNRNTQLPKLNINQTALSLVTSALNQGLVVTVHAQELRLHNWVGVGLIVANPQTGVSGYLIVGGLNSAIQTIQGGAIWDTITTLVAYGWAGYNISKDTLTALSGAALLSVAEPTLVTKVAGVAQIGAGLFSLPGHANDFMDLVTGAKKPSDYIGEQVTDLLVDKALGHMAHDAFEEAVLSLAGPGLSQAIQDIGKLGGNTVNQLISQGVPPVDLVRLSQSQASPTAFQQVETLAAARGPTIAHELINNDLLSALYISGLVADLAAHAPLAPGVDQVVQNAVSVDTGLEWPPIIDTATTSSRNGAPPAAYTPSASVNAPQVTSFDQSGNPVLSGPVSVVAAADFSAPGNVWVDSCYNPRVRKDPRVLNMLLSYQAAISAGKVKSVSLQCAGPVDPWIVAWAATNTPGVQIQANVGDFLR